MRLPANPTRYWRIGGRVQGVGFRPFVYRLAQSLTLTGWVQNRLGDVDIVACGPAPALEQFEQRLLAEAPPTARPALLTSHDHPNIDSQAFTILPSAARDAAEIHIPPDYFACPDCLSEIHDRTNRRYRYPFTNCTQCGPRYTLIQRLPYDRANTGMADFPLCPDCAREYDNPLDRRFHAEPIACPVCGPQLFYSGERDATLSGEAALEGAVTALRQGHTVAVLGIGGFHLLCDATSDTAVRQLRTRKHRPHKPLAVLFPHPDRDTSRWLQRECDFTPQDYAALNAPERPILLLPRSSESTLPASIAPGLPRIGALLPYSPLHELLVSTTGIPLVATSGNLSGEPVLTDPVEGRDRLRAITPHCLWHDRPIERPADDSVMHNIDHRPQPIRLGRGLAPLESTLPRSLESPVLAVGAHMKLTLALAWKQRLVVSPHLSDMGSLRAQQVLEQLVTDLPRLYATEPAHILCDLHPGYSTSRWAEQQQLPVTRIAHHHAHAAALYGEYALAGDALIFTWDGTGLGPDGTLWGGETLLGRPGHWQRYASLRPFRMPAGDQAALTPWRCAAGLAWSGGTSFATPESLDSKDMALLRHAWEQDINMRDTTAIGRLFDAASSFTGVLQTASFDGQGPMLLEALAGSRPGHPWPVEFMPAGDDRLLLDWQGWLNRLNDNAISPEQRAADFHETLSRAIVAIALRARDAQGVNRVGLTGGVFQNRRLTERSLELLTDNGFETLIPRRYPCNDAAISVGQVMEFCLRD